MTTSPPAANLAAEPAATSAHGIPPIGEDAHKPGQLDFEIPAPAVVTRTRVLGLLAAGIAILGVAFLARWIPKHQARAALEADTRISESVTLRVQIIAPTVVTSDRALSLPGSVQALEESVLYPRANGYVHKWLKDLGDKVDDGELLAEIDTPDLDQQIAQARAQLAQVEAALLQARANARFSKGNLERYMQLVPAGLASQQDLEKNRAQAEVDQAGIGVAEANIGAQRANLQMLSQLKSFARVTAPFAGRITARYIDRGNLVSAGTGTPLFRLAATDPVRVFLQVPQDVAPSVRADMAANVSIREFPGRTFVGKVARAAGALDANTRTMTTEVRVPNPNGEIITGMYTNVALTLPTPHRVLSLPASVLMNDASGLRVAIVDATSHLHIVPVVLERDLGPTIEVASGITPEDRVVKLASADLVEGRLVEIAR